MNIPRTFKAILEGTVWAAIGVVALVCFAAARGQISETPTTYHGGLFHNDFARRWTSGDGPHCAGWTNALVFWIALGEVLHWWAYVVISFVLRRLHPVLKGVSQARVAIGLACIFFVGCGGAHLLNAYSMFDPIYPFVAAFVNVNGIISVLGSIAIAYALVTAFAAVEKKRRKLDEFEAHDLTRTKP